ncbi:MAG: hypothetical protein KDA84_22720, partial [Planctomycetaceae bacterium]|nr:hypothetical protein [Planctomycetaceae bacterium]
GKLTPQHEISSDQKRWKAASDVSGLGVADRNSTQESPPQTVNKIGRVGGQGLQFALGVLLLVVLTMVVAGACLLNLGLLVGAVFTGLFLMTLGLGYPAACLGRDVSAIYVPVVAVAWVLLLDDSAIRFGTTLSSWLGFAVGLVPGVLIVVGWTLITRGLGHDNEMADMARLNPSRFSSTPVSQKECQYAIAATGGEFTLDAPRRVRLRLDPDDLDRAEESLGETIEQEARRSVPGLAVSFAFHIVLLLIFAILPFQLLNPDRKPI